MGNHDSYSDLLFTVTIILALLAKLLLPPIQLYQYVALLFVGTVIFLVSSLKWLLPWTSNVLEAPPGDAIGWLTKPYQLILSLAVTVIISLWANNPPAMSFTYPTIANLQQLTNTISASLGWSTVFSFVYSILALLPFWAPAEFPMILVSGWVSWFVILASCALGKAIAGVIFSLLFAVIDGKLSGRLSQFAESKNSIVTLLRRYKNLGFFLSQGVPFFPMRSGLVVFSFFNKHNHRTVFTIMFLGTLCRNTITFGAIRYGLIPLVRLFK